MYIAAFQMSRWVDPISNRCTKLGPGNAVNTVIFMYIIN